MAVEPGFAGQKFIPEILPKIEYVDRLRREFNKELLIEVDGNISPATAKLCIEAGADILVLGTSSIFKPSKELYSSTVQFKEMLEGIIEKLA
jgi:ribulose-phosphate 3-epimerase